MNDHFEDALEQVRKAMESAKEGIKTELEPIEERIRELTGRDQEPEPEPSRIDRLVDDLRALEERAEGEARQAIETAREQLRAYREGGN